MTPSLLSNPVLRPIFYLVGRLGLFLFGWKTCGKMPDEKKFILIAAPHSSNWDFVFFLFIVFTFGIPVHWMGKHTMFIPPFKRLLKRLGGIPIDRTQKGNTVATLADEYQNAKQLIITIAPSGTRKPVTEWKTGFYRIAHRAGVPIVCGFVDYKKRIGGIGPVVMPSGDMEADLERMRNFYKDKSGRYD